ncbi:MAG: sarcosine oxidase subunit delta [Pseudomonadota bacterium]
MLLLTCPNCGLAVEETELTPGGEAHLTRMGPDSAAEAFEGYLFLRDNAKGVVFERWRHSHGCGKWFLAARHSVTMEVFGTYPAQTTEPPAHILDRIRERTGT